MKRNGAVGGVLWTVLLVASISQICRLSTIEMFFLLAPLVIVPLGFELCAQFLPSTEIISPIRIAKFLQLPAALCAVASFFLRPGLFAALLVAPWLIFGCAMGLAALWNAFRGRIKTLAMVCANVSFLYLPVGCAWLLASRLGMTPMDFQEPIVLLTAVHFHFAGFAAPLLTLAGGSRVTRRDQITETIFKLVTAGVLAGPGLLAAGFVVGPRLKLAAALVVACSQIGLSCFFFLACARSLRPRLAQALVTISAISVSFAMVFAAVWAIGEFPLQPFVHLDQMARFHGTANGFGFILCGLTGWILSARQIVHGERGPK